MKVPFNVKYRPKIESGEYKVETRDGRPAKIIYWEAKDCKPIIALIPQHLMKMEVVLRFYADGQFSSNGKKTMCDLFIVTPEEEMSDFEQEVSDIVEYCKKNGENVADGYAKRHAKSLLILAREQFIKDGYVIEKKAFHDAVKRVDPKVIKEVSEKWGAMKEALRIEYERGKADALKDIPRWKRFAPNINDTLSEQRICNELENSVLRVDASGYYWVISREELNKLPKDWVDCSKI